ncbi:small ubiquitin-like protein [Fragilariopsis cylindrus CCMP1102]|uniref:Small ubiquitin-like protein n=1 Tax=Fragilariopsis cylindrus CCMP1102 TaxID=635003 RepID=A0A1E7FWC5_9STRA|nr:small ubiquitin-like protein [Fragilariopsis cylindrus CCMP1102]|eukprot:OEU22446.1 small ubiquitin-like protein [Fragilariopsis cylindrus CCMP1102]
MSDNEGGAGAPEAKNEPITIRVRDQTGEETFFKIKKSTKMSKVFNTYAQRKGVQMSSLRFLLDGERIAETMTPQDLELDDQDQIDCMLEQSGGL